MSKKTSPKSFEDAIARLETITQTMQNNVLPLEESLALYQEGNELVGFCQEKLATVEHSLQMLDNNQLKDWELESE